MPTGDPVCPCGCGAMYPGCLRQFDRLGIRPVYGAPPPLPIPDLDEAPELRRQLEIQQNTIVTLKEHLASSRAMVARLQAENERLRGELEASRGTP